jgi:hypothetical protein
MMTLYWLRFGIAVMSMNFFIISMVAVPPVLLFRKSWNASVVSEPLFFPYFAGCPNDKMLTGSHFVQLPISSH